MSDNQKPELWHPDDHRQPGEQQMTSVIGGDEAARGLVEPVTGLEQRPCLACRSWEKNEKKLRQHINSKRAVEVRPDGEIISLADKDIPGRKTKTYNIRDFGWCRYWTMPTDNQATCEKWVPTKSISDMMRKLGRR